MKSVLSITFFLIAFLSVIAKAEEVPPTLQPNTLKYSVSTVFETKDICPSPYTNTGYIFLSKNDAQNFVFQNCSGAYLDIGGGHSVTYNQPNYSYPSGDSGNVRIYGNRTDDNSLVFKYFGVIASQYFNAYVCPASHPYTVTSDPQTGEPTLCTDLSPNCLSGTTIGSDILTNSGLDTVCTPPSSGSPYYCSFQKKVGYDHSYQPYTVYTSTGTECSALDSNAIDDPFIEPTGTPQPDPNCTAVGNEIQACPANEADHCTTDGGVQICDSNCGNYQGQFVCFSEMNPSNEDGDSELDANPNNDSDGDGVADQLGVLKDIDKNTDALEQIGKNQIKAINALGDKLSNTGGTGVLDGGQNEQPEECNADNLWCGMFEERPDEEATIQQIDTQMQEQLDDAEIFITTEQPEETEIKGFLDSASNDFITGISGTLPTNTGGCANVSLDLPGQAQNSTSVMCQVADPFRSMMAWAFMVLVALHGWSVFRRYFLPYGA